MFGIPENGIGMEILCRVEPEMELLLSVSLSLTEHIGMQCIWISAKIPKELKVNLIMCRSLRRKLHIIIQFSHQNQTQSYTKTSTLCQKNNTYIVSSDGSSRVPCNELELHVDLAKEVLMLRLETRTRNPVKRKGKKLAIVEDISSFITPGNVEVLVEATSSGHCQERTG